MPYPIVTVGLPTYNRPELLRRRIQNILSQSFTAFELVICDNASPNPEVGAICREAVEKDSRVRYVRHATNIGAAANFVFAFQQGRGEFFAWAADDDEWDLSFLEVSVASIGRAQLFAPPVFLHYHLSGDEVPIELPMVSPESEPWKDLCVFRENTQPSMVYGLHRRDGLENFMRRGGFDLWDVALLFDALVGRGIIVGQGTWYKCGIPDAEYAVKVFGLAASPGLISYRGFALSLLRSCWGSERFSGFGQRLRLTFVASNIALNLITHLTAAHPSVARTHHKALLALDWRRWRRR